MYLKKVELSGFKSFAKTTTLEFPSRITAIVGPNGSGKSNIAEAIRWVLGEQSMKSLRGKRGEDLIWSGSPASPAGRSQIARMGKASVSLLFDNANGRIPIEFEEVILGRKIFRDGVNEYAINDSPVRLKDVVELMARIGLGETKHNIIGQGEVDRMLLATPRERREMLEEALGLRVYQLKKEEAERKIEATERNMEQVEGLAREIAPHLKFLRSQAKRAEARESIEGELRGLERIYIARESEEIAKEEELLRSRRKPLAEKHALLRKEIERLTKEYAAANQGALPPEASAAEQELAAAIKKRQELERELGRLEGKLEAEREKVARIGENVGDLRPVAEEIRASIAEVRSLVEEEDRIEILRSHLLVLVEDIERALERAERVGKTTVQTKDAQSPLVYPHTYGVGVGVKELETTIRKLEEELKETQKVILQGEEERRRGAEALRSAHERLRSADSALRAKRDDEREVVLSLERLKFDEERLRERKDAFGREAGAQVAEMTSQQLGQYEGVSQADLHKKIERLRARLEEIGGIDEAVAKEYEETEARHSFLTKELDDLKQAHASLKALIKELDQHIKKDFREDFAKIKNEFHNYFRIIFGGGAAKLRITNLESRITDEEGTEEEKEKEEGIEIDVDLPRKRIHGLAMLSGGERALVAVALLFAITAVNPPPFLVLDETDAALDEANSQRYAAILKELAKKTQLILITHNRETMKAAGILYGVTMGDDGVSRLLSLKLEEAEEYTVS